MNSPVFSSLIGRICLPAELLYFLICFFSTSAEPPGLSSEVSEAVMCTSILRCFSKYMATCHLFCFLFFSCSHHSASEAPCFLQGAAAERVFLVSKAEGKTLDLRLSLPTMSIAFSGMVRAGGAHCLCPTDLGSGAAVTSAKPVGPPQCCQWMGRCTAPWTAMVWSPWLMDPQPSCSPMDSFCQRW